MIRVVGIGNELRRDDGFGPVVARELRERELPDGVTALDYGARVVHLAFDLVGSDATTVFVDAADLSAAAGTVAVVQPRFDALDVVVSGHDISLDAVAAMVHRLGGELGGVLLVGCQPLDTSDGIGLSAPVAQAVPAAIECVLDVVRSIQQNGTLPVGEGIRR